jgi:hypothetical protein
MGSVVECLPKIHEALDSISSTKKKKKQEVGKGPKWNFSKDRE